jgi:hypothetical protein
MYDQVSRVVASPQVFGLNICTYLCIKESVQMQVKERNQTRVTMANVQPATPPSLPCVSYIPEVKQSPFFLL